MLKEIEQYLVFKFILHLIERSISRDNSPQFAHNL